MTFNVLFSNTNQEEVAETIIDSRADLVGLQELTRLNAPRLTALLENIYPFHTPLPTGRTPHVMLYSRYPILETTTLNLPFGDRSWLTTIDLGETRIQVIVLHLVATNAGQLPVSDWVNRISERLQLRSEQVNLIVEAVLASHDPVLVLCDCNFTEFSDTYDLLDGVLDDSFAEVGLGFGHTIHPQNLDFRYQRIDYVWHSSEFTPISTNVIPGGGSDHNPVVAEFGLTP